MTFLPLGTRDHASGAYDHMFEMRDHALGACDHALGHVITRVERVITHSCALHAVKFGLFRAFLGILPRILGPSGCIFVVRFV